MSHVSSTDLEQFKGFTPGPWKAERDICHYDTLSNVVSCEEWDDRMQQIESLLRETGKE